MQLNRRNLKQKMKTKDMTTLHLRKLIGRRSLRLAFLLLPLTYGWFALSPIARALLPPPAPDGGYPGNNTAEGTSALFNLTSGIDNSALGFQALYHNTGGHYNTAEGFRALFANTTGFQNTANGVNALFSNSTGSYNTANGVNTLYRNTTGYDNTATGAGALFSSTTGGANTALGRQALFNNTADQNTATGAGALLSNTTGFQNTANGTLALSSNTDGRYNTANGFEALYANTGSDNTGNGAGALHNNTTGIWNTAIGSDALYNNTTGHGNIAIGFFAGGALTTGSFNIDIDNTGVDGEGNTIRIGGDQTATFIAGIYGATVSGGTGVYVLSDGHLGTVTSSARFKQNIQAMDKSSELLLSLRPVTFRYKPELDPKGLAQFGLVAEEVEKVNPDLVVRDAQGEPYTVRYEAVNAMLLNEFLKAHRKMEEQNRKIQEQEATLTQLKSTVLQQQKGLHAVTVRLEEQASQIQNVSAQLAAASPSRGGHEVSKPAPQMVLNDQ
jgi:hypothetical protein